MTSRVYKFTTANTNNLRQVTAGQGVFKGGSFVNTHATDWYYLKLFWFSPTSSAAAPTVGTTVPDMVIGVPPMDDTTGIPGVLNVSWPGGITKQGNLYVAVVTGALDSDNTAVAANQGVLSIIVDG